MRNKKAKKFGKTVLNAISAFGEMVEKDGTGSFSTYYVAKALVKGLRLLADVIEDIPKSEHKTISISVS